VRPCLIFIVLVSLAGPARGQAPPPRDPICPNQTGAPLLACLRSGYARTTVVPYDLARDYLYGRNGQTGFYSAPYTGVYSGRSGPLGGGASPTQIDTEHTWPRSLMPDPGLQEGEMHNLYPTISKVNNDRGNLPFGEVDDAQTNGWYGPTGGLPQAMPPTTDRDAYSERLTNVRFEPREDHKGNVARVLAYFYTFYGTSDAAFWEVQRPVLLAWNRADPPDDAERARSHFIRTRQGNDNPYILDTTLIGRAFAPSVATEPPQAAALLLALTPRPTRGLTTLTGTLPAPAQVHVVVLDALGRRVRVLPPGAAAGTFSRTLDLADLPPGLYIVHVRGEGSQPFARTFPLVRLR
jgi:hypothetical protein